MSTSDFNEVVSEFFDVQQWGGTATLIKTSSVYDPNTSENVVTTSTFTMQAMVFDYLNKFEGLTTQANTLIKTGDKMVYLKPNSLVTSIDPSADKLQIGSTIYKIITLKEMNPNGVNPLYYELFVRV